MKKIFVLLIILLINISLLAQGDINGGGSQGKNYVSKINSSTTLLDSSATFTGPWESCWDYSTVELTIKSNKNSATLGVKVQFSDDKSAISNLTTFSYTANDTLTNARLIPVAGSYVRVIYTNTNSAQTGKFNLSTRFFSKPILPLTQNGKVAVDDITVTGGAINLTSYATPAYGNVTVGVTADTLSGTSVACAEVWIMNLSPGKTLYFGFNASITTSNAYGALGYLDDVKIRLPNLNKIYLISDTASTDVRYTYFNY